MKKLFLSAILLIGLSLTINSKAFANTDWESFASASGIEKKDDSSFMTLESIFELRSDNPKDRIKKAVFRLDESRKNPYITVKYQEECTVDRTVYGKVFGEAVEIKKVPARQCVPKESEPIKIKNLVYIKDPELSDEFQTVGRIVYSAKAPDGSQENLLCAEVQTTNGQYGRTSIYDYNRNHTYFKRVFSKEDYGCKLSWDKKPVKENGEFVSYVTIDVPLS